MTSGRGDRPPGANRPDRSSREHADSVAPESGTAAVGHDSILSVRDLRVEFFGRDGGPVRAVRGVSFDVRPGESLGLVGESGSGKSVTALSILGLVPPRVGRVTSGSAVFEGRDLIGLPEQQLRTIRGSRIAMIFQDPLSSLNPVLTIGRQLTEQLEAHRSVSARAARVRAGELLGLVGIPGGEARLDDYPHQFSGGMRQRAMIAMALSCEPSLLIADEPTTALDVTVQAQILALLQRLRAELDMSVLLITHDLGVVAGFADRVAVMYAGQIVEHGPTQALLAEPAHPYAIGLIRSVPRLDVPRQESLIPIDGVPPDLAAQIPGCPFAPRCAWRIDRCKTVVPTLAPAQGVSERSGVHDVACHNQPRSIVLN